MQLHPHNKNSISHVASNIQEKPSIKSKSLSCKKTTAAASELENPR